MQNVKQKNLHRTIAALLGSGALLCSSHAMAESWTDAVTISGVAEVEVGFGDDASDVTAATVELGIEAAINERVGASILLLHEEDDTPGPVVDEAIISLDLSGDGSLQLNGGQMYVPFGVYETNLVSDPLTLEIGETNESALQLAYESGNVYGSAYIFNGDTIETDADDTIEHLGFNVGFANDNLDINLSYINAVGNSDGLDQGTVTSYASGIGISVVYTQGAFTVIGEQITTDEVDGAELSASNIEVGYDMGNDMYLAVAYQATDEAGGFDLPETRIAAAVSTSIFEDAGLAVEIASETDYADEDTSVVTIQLAAEF